MRNFPYFFFLSLVRLITFIFIIITQLSKCAIKIDEAESSTSFAKRVPIALFKIVVAVFMCFAIIVVLAFSSFRTSTVSFAKHALRIPSIKHLSLNNCKAA